MTTQSRERVGPENVPPLDVEYPDSDGEPIGETDFHISNILYLRQALRRVFRNTEDIYVAANMLFYYQEGDPAACRAPDVFAVQGVARHDRRTFKVWEEGKVPSLVIEVTSKKSQVEDLWIKRGLYEKLGIREYLLFDPLGEYLDPRFQAFLLEERLYVPRPLSETGGYRSATFEIEFRPSESMLRVIDPESGDHVPLLDEAMDRAQAESERAQAESERAQAESERAQAESERAQDLEEELRRYRERFGPLNAS